MFISLFTTYGSYMTRVLVLLLSLLPTIVFSAPKSELWDYWNSHDPLNVTEVNHQPWQDFLNLYLIDEGEYSLVHYQKVTDSDKQQLKQYIADLAAITPQTLRKEQQYAYWVNLYNAITVDIILANYPLKSITKLGGIFSFGPWGDDAVKIDGKTLTLNDIEHRILRPIWNDPRTHYAVNCASLGCPNLQKEAFTATNSDALLTKAAREFINSEKGLLITEKRSQLSSIYEWFADDFGGEDNLLEHLKQYRSDLPPSLINIEYQYDWSLNEVKL